MDNLLESLENYYNNCKKNDNSTNVKSVYEELAEKEEALVLAANFGKTLLEEKEQLEVQLDSLKKEYQNKIEILEQEKYGLKLLIEQMRNEYENKIYELGEDMHLMSKQIETQQNERNIKLNENNTYINIIQELTEKNQNLLNELKISRDNYYGLEEKYHKLEADLEESEVKYSENIQLLNNYKKEISLQIKKQQEYEYLLMQTCNDRDHKCKLLDEANNKLAYYENEKQNLDQIVYEQERQIIDLQALNEELTIKLENFTTNNNNNNSNINQSNATTHRHKSINNYIHKLASRNSTTFYDDEFDDYFDIFKLNDVSNINWQDECQINEQNQNSNQTNNTTTSTTTTNNTTTSTTTTTTDDDDDYNKENENSNNDICHLNEIRDDNNDNTSNNSINTNTTNNNSNDTNNSDKDQIDDNNNNTEKMNNETINSSDYYDESMY